MRGATALFPVPALRPGNTNFNGPIAALSRPSALYIWKLASGQQPRVVPPKALRRSYSLSPRLSLRLCLFFALAVFPFQSCKGHSSSSLSICAMILPPVSPLDHLVTCAILGPQFVLRAGILRTVVGLFKLVFLLGKHPEIPCATAIRCTDLWIFVSSHLISTNCYFPLHMDALPHLQAQPASLHPAVDRPGGLCRSHDGTPRRQSKCSSASRGD